MGVANVPSAAGGGIKTVQRGSAGASGNVTISAINIAKSFVTIFGSASSGTVSASFGLNTGSFNILSGTRNNGASPTGNDVIYPNGYSGFTAATQSSPDGNSRVYFAQNATINSLTPNAGSNNLVAAQVTGFLADSTTLTVSGACRYEIVEFA